MLFNYAMERGRSVIKSSITEEQKYCTTFIGITAIKIRKQMSVSLFLQPVAVFIKLFCYNIVSYFIIIYCYIL